MAYVLGFWYADGYMRHERSYRIVFYSNDGNQWKLGYGEPDTKKLLKFMYYPGCELYLDRKAQFLAQMI